MQLSVVMGALWRDPLERGEHNRLHDAKMMLTKGRPTTC